MTSIQQGERYMHLANGRQVVVTEVDAKIQVQGIGPSGGPEGRKWRVRPESFRREHNPADGGRSARSGYVLLDSLPDTHPLRNLHRSAALPERNRVVIPDEDFDVTALDTAALTNFIAKMEAQANALKPLVKAAKTEMRQRTDDVGLRIFGDVTVVASPGEKFSAELAHNALQRGVITRAEYDAICVTAPDATRAKAVLGEKNPKYRAMLKDNGYTLTVRPATDKDRETLALKEERENLERERFVPGSTISDTTAA